MDGLSSAASVIAVIQLAGSIVKICGDYIQEVKKARDEILELQQAVTDLEGVLRELNVKEIVSDLQGYKSTFTLSLNIDQVAVVAGIHETTDRIDYRTSLSQLLVAQGAQFDSYENQHEDYCLPGTRVALLRQIEEWASSPSGKGIFWLNGRAGTGKSTISRTITQTLSKTNLLGENFFFKRGEGDRGNATKLLPTITRQLVRSITGLFPGVQKALQDNSDISKED
ncbi:uncharacterized protein N7487_011642 [Penicillium crustosum]|uniref:uncharacterized protein n=1 Tax=Penicillium crustosum TaxID=36656 RepID=UPI002398CFA7|nr:uncharacterized protein N7487_011642 [Penicillium crustosum]KAJ5394001.1 hypothetical protein N7487_011642 [Penicillium crustosum]